MTRNEGFPSQTIWVSGGAKPIKENVISSKRKQEIARNKKIKEYEIILKEEAREKKEREQAYKKI